MPYSPPRQPRRRPFRHAMAWLRRVVGLLLVGLVVVGMGTTTNPSTGGISGSTEANAGPGDTADRTAVEGLHVLVASTAALVASIPPPTDSTSGKSPAATGRPVSGGGSASTADADSVAEMGAVGTMLARHVDLLTPASQSSPSAPSPPPGESRGEEPPERTPLQLANSLAESGNRLVSASIQAPAARSRAMLGAGIEELLAARTLARSIGGAQAAASLPAGPDAWTSADAPPAHWKEVAGQSFATGPCDAPAAQSGPLAPAPAHALTALADSPEIAAAPAASTATDAAYRLAYAYELAAARTAGEAAEASWRTAAAREGLGALLQGFLPPDCPPLRHAAYEVPDGFDASPRTALGAGEAQLAVALRDLAAAAPMALRPLLVAEAFRAAVAARAAGVEPRLT